MDDGTEVEILRECPMCFEEVSIFTPLDWHIYRRRKPQVVTVECPECAASFDHEVEAE